MYCLKLILKKSKSQLDAELYIKMIRVISSRETHHDSSEPVILWVTTANYAKHKRKLQKLHKLNPVIRVAPNNEFPAHITIDAQTTFSYPNTGICDVVDIFL